MIIVSKEEKFFTSWSETRKKGKWKFILFNGVFLGGVGYSLGKVVLNLFLGEWVGNIAEYISGALVFGIIFGTGIWVYTENRYKKYIANKY
ncbi:hypothetical protein Q9251_21780 [Alkalihalobacillus macyae]|uniref:hypothetical protein n=1 Tax=Guptibacillus hwajinpoensis TaxID=208199 RepID=UPI00273CCC92|nr:hypothetical protein [Alkalihalobacillus macyae]MDP4553487.1 hypothetical protein [Alkalihalobacillus macyae]